MYSPYSNKAWDLVDNLITKVISRSNQVKQQLVRSPVCCVWCKQVYSDLGYYYSTPVSRVQITPKTSTNISRHLYSRRPVLPVFHKRHFDHLSYVSGEKWLKMLIFHRRKRWMLAKFCEFWRKRVTRDRQQPRRRWNFFVYWRKPERTYDKKDKNWPQCFNVNDFRSNKSLIARFCVFCGERFWLVSCILTRPTGSPKYSKTRKNIPRYYTLNRPIRYMYFKMVGFWEGNGPTSHIPSQGSSVCKK